MKIRSGFVSNSSSSSFICDVCGASEGGFDISLSDVNMCMCEEEHVFCTRHAVNTDLKDYEEYFEEDRMPVDFNSYIDKAYGNDILKIYCPICQFKSLSKDDLLKYMMKELNFKSMDDMFNRIKEKFESYDDFRSYIK